VDNRGPGAPTLAVSDPFGEAMYEVAAGQHVLFEHGSLHEVVDQEKNSCGCPESSGMSVADALLASGGTKTMVVAPAAAAPAPVVTAVVPVTPVVAAATPAQPDTQAQLQSAEQTASAAAMKSAEEKHPFPTAVSEGLAPAEPAPATAPGAPRVQVADTLSYNAPAPAMSAPSAATTSKKGKKGPAVAASTQPVAGQPAAPAVPKPPGDLVHVVGRFFKRLFGG
jgi:hypothetical protein